MKKIIIILLFILPLHASVQQGQLNLAIGQVAVAQCAAPGAGDPSGSSGGGFWNWLGNAVHNIGQAICDFVKNKNNNNTPGEGFDEENADWMLVNNDWLPSGGYNPWDDPFWGPMGYSDGEWDILNNWEHYFDVYASGGNPPAPPQNDTGLPVNGNLQPGRYYITRQGNPRKYFEDDTLFMARSQQGLPLKLNQENRNYVNATGLRWKRKDTLKCSDTDTCRFNIQVPGTTALLVDSANVLRRTKNTLIVYKSPTIVFQRGSGYTGGYAFDDSAHKHYHIRNNPRYKAGYEVRKVNDDTAYVVPWLGLLDSQSVTLNIKKLDINTAAKKDPDFYVDFKPTNGDIKLNGLTTLRLDYTALSNLNTLTVIAKEWNSDADKLKIIGSVNVITNSGDTIGKLNLSCVKPVKKRLVLVYVNTGNGLRNLPKDKFLDSLNKHSHNQLFRQWVFDTAHFPDGTDTLDLTSEYNSNVQVFFNGDTLMKPENIDSFYLRHNGVDMLFGVNNGYSTVNNDSSTKVHFVFLFNYDMQSVQQSRVVGMTQHGGYKCLLWRAARYQTIAHELGHIMRLKHTFSNSQSPPKGYNIPQESTFNFMDYTLVNGIDPSNMFYFAQWVDL